jgi:hypothetical protein
VRWPVKAGEGRHSQRRGEAISPGLGRSAQPQTPMAAMAAQRSFGFARVRSPQSKPLQTTGFGELTRTGANARQPLPCRRSRVRVPSSALSLNPPICAGGAPVWTRQAAPRPAAGPFVACARPVRAVSQRRRTGLGPPVATAPRPGGPAERPAVTHLGGSRLRNPLETAGSCLARSQHSAESGEIASGRLREAVEDRPAPVRAADDWARRLICAPRGRSRDAHAPSRPVPGLHGSSYQTRPQ